MRSPARTTAATFPIGDLVKCEGAQGREAAGVADHLPRARLSVFLNIPYDSAFRELYLAYIAGVSSLS